MRNDRGSPSRGGRSGRSSWTALSTSTSSSTSASTSTSTSTSLPPRPALRLSVSVLDDNRRLSFRSVTCSPADSFTRDPPEGLDRQPTIGRMPGEDRCSLREDNAACVRLQRSKHHERVNEPARGMIERVWQTPHDLESERLPEPHRTLARAHDEIE